MGKYITGDCIGEPISSIHKFPVVFTYGLQDLTGFIVCSDSCVEAEASHPNSFVYPNASSVKLIPKSSLVLKRENYGVTSTRVKLIPEFPFEQYYLTIPEIVILKPVMPHSCSELDISIDVPNNFPFPLPQPMAILAVVLTNKGKVWCSVCGTHHWDCVLFVCRAVVC